MINIFNIYFKKIELDYLHRKMIYGNVLFSSICRCGRTMKILKKIKILKNVALVQMGLKVSFWRKKDSLALIIFLESKNLGLSDYRCSKTFLALKLLETLVTWPGNKLVTMYWNVKEETINLFESSTNLYFNARKQ